MAIRRWHPIEDLPSNWHDLVVPEFAALAKVWSDQRATLQEGDRLNRFNERLRREFAVETGVLERLYTLERGITMLLIERGIDAALIPHSATNRDPEVVAALIRDQHEAAVSLFDFVAGNRQFSTAYVKEIHALLTRNQPTTEARDGEGRLIRVELRRGDWKLLPNNPQRPNGSIYEYCPPEQVSSEMDRLVALHLRHLEDHVSPEVEAAWLHHRFTQIHPFQDGNGRVARCLASLVLIRAQWFPLVVSRDDRARYVTSLEQADGGDLTGLVELVVSLQRKGFVGALSLAREVERRERVSQIVDAARRDLQRRRDAARREWHKLLDTAKHLLEHAATRLKEISRELETSLDVFGPSFELSFFTDHEGPDQKRSHWFHRQVIESAKELQYYANLHDHHQWARLTLRSKRQPAGRDQAEVLITIHGLGREYTGVLAASALFFRRQRDDEEGGSHPTVSRPLCDEVFQLNYVETKDEALNRFEPWLEDALARGLDTWRKAL